MPEELFYLLIIFSVVTGLLLIRIVTARNSRRRKGRRLERKSQSTSAKGRWGKITESGFESMARKVSYEQALVAHDWVVLDPADIGLIESVYKKTLREGEERLMLAVLESAVECFQKHVLARKPSGKQLFREAEEWFLAKDGEAPYSFESICETLGAASRPHTEGLDGLEGSKA
jgi:hypothetical protein